MERYKEKTEHELLAGLQEGNYLAFSEIHRRYAPLLFRHAVAIVNDAETAQDAIQDVFVTLWEKRQELSVRTTLSGYIYAMTRNSVLAYIRKTRYIDKYLEVLHREMEAEPPADNLLIEKELARKIEDEIGRLPPKMREIFQLSRHGNHSYQQISQKTGVTSHTVRKQISNALKILRTKLSSLLSINL